MPVGLVDVHRPAQNDDAVVTPRVRLGVRFAAEVHVADAEAAIAQQRVEMTQRLGSDVLQDEDLAHEGFGGRGRGIIPCAPDCLMSAHSANCPHSPGNSRTSQGPGSAPQREAGT